jgi:DNA-binding transcriptional LysR family regulator
VALRSYQRVGAFKNHDPETIPYVTPSSELKDNPLSLKIRDGWNHQLARQIAFRTNSLAIALEMAKSGSCAIYLPSLIVDGMDEKAVGRLEALPLPAKRRTAEMTKRDLYLVKRKNDEETKTMKKVVRIVRQIASQAPG